MDDDDDIDAIVQHVARHFPFTTPGHIAAIAAEELARLDGRPIQLYVPNLAEHATRQRLHAEADARRA